MLAPETLFHARYRVVRPIKSGGMGAVFEVTDETTRRRRALKVMLPHTIEDPKRRELFAQEATITGNIQSDHIVQVSDAGIDDATSMPFLVMDLLQGEELGELVKRRGPLPFGEVALFLFQASLALDKTHEGRIVHRDLKPENLFVTTRDDGSPCLKILDYGVAKLVVETTLSPNAERTALVGTPLYMAPEQIRGDGAVGPRADVYALGHVAYTLLTGEAYWAPDAKYLASLYVLFNKIIAGLPEPASARAAKRQVRLGTSFDLWFQRVVATDPRRRPEKASVAVAQLCEALGVPIPGPAITPSAPLRDVPPTSPPPPDPPPSSRPFFSPSPAAYAQAAPAPRPRPFLRPEPPRAPTPVPAKPIRREEPPPSARDREKESRDKPAPRSRPARAADSYEDDAPLFRDEATQAYSERYLRLKLDEEINLSKKWGEKLSIVFFEAAPAVDEPRDKTDESVREVVSAIQRFVPKDVFLGRYGAAGLVLVLRGAGRTKARALAKVLEEKVRAQLAKQDATARLAAKLRIGAARVDPLEKSAVDFIERAAKAARAGQAS